MPPARRAAWQHEGREADVRGEPAVGARASLQVFKSVERINEQVRLNHRFAVGRSADCALQLQWDGVSKRHMFIEAYVLPDGGSDERGERVRWFLTGCGTNGTFLNSVKVENGRLERLRDGDVIGIGKASGLPSGMCVPHEKELEYMFVFRQEESKHATPLPPPPPAKHPGTFEVGRMRPQATAGAVNNGRGADPHDKPQVPPFLSGFCASLRCNEHHSISSI